MECVVEGRTFSLTERQRRRSAVLTCAALTDISGGFRLPLTAKQFESWLDVEIRSVQDAPLHEVHRIFKVIS